ncbi:BatE protein [Flavobacterium cyanobacteriorum]|uniref:BatE protein n=1 Tax=Flavobacterium cyanobacteriorum TaxID=2022802 RepID=A0A255Z5B4_9FLAO|nr:tetratricopeptide repeat protein [Flavobacterium cyanobacteriorum]OYQ36622.1 BatE protein [Flavobacterium cyanobacteriorum]
MKNLVYIALFFTQALWAQPAFDKGNALYRKGKYEEAIQQYESILKEKKQSAELYFNLGNAYYKTGRIAPAIYNFEKALQLNPHSKDIKTNLGFAQRMAIDDIKAVPKGGISRLLYRFAGRYHYDSWARAAVAFASAAFLFFLGYYFSGIISRKQIFFAGMGVAVAAMCISIIFAFFVRSEAGKDRPAIVFSEMVSVKGEPNNSAPDAFILHEGAKVNVTDTLDNWKKIQLPDDTEGWLHKDAVRELNN